MEDPSRKAEARHDCKNSVASGQNYVPVVYYRLPSVYVCFHKYSVLSAGWMQWCDHDAIESSLLFLYPK